MYTADIPMLPTTKTALYADDIALYTSSFQTQAAKFRIAHHLSLMTTYFDKWKLKVNPRKTELIVFSRKSSNNQILSPLMVQNTPIMPVKYLGFRLDARLRFKSHISNAVQKTAMAQRKLYSLLAPNSFLSPQNKLLLYTSTIRPILTYGAPIWHSVSDFTRRRVQMTQNRCLKSVLSADRCTRNTELHEATGMPYIADYIDNISAKFYHSG
ncbi:hypothetical protein YQE_05992, partial [Dendroctonus ponderosae]